MYFVKYGKDYLHDPRVDGYELLDLSFDAEENSCGYCDFTIYPTHPMYDKLRERDADNPIEVYDDDILLFSGFIYELGKEFYLDGHVKCKGELDYLTESIVRPYSTLQRGYGTTVPATVNGYFEWLIEQHNNQVKENKRFVVGINQGGSLYDNNYIYRENDKYPSTMSEISDKLLGYLGGYLRIRHENGVRYIDYLKEWSDTNTQILDFGVNLTDYTQTDNSDNLATFVVPLGAKLSDTYYNYNPGYEKTKDTKFDKTKEYYTKDDDQYMSCTNLNYFLHGIVYCEYVGGKYVATTDTNPVDSKTYYVKLVSKYSRCTNITAFAKGVTYYEYNADNDESNQSITVASLDNGEYDVSGYKKSGDMIYCESAVSKYGWIGITYEGTDITEKENLRRSGTLYLKEFVSPERTIEIKAVDMHLINPNIKPIRIGEYVRVRSRPHHLDSYFLCTSIDLDLNNPENSIYTLGTTFDTLTGQQNKKINELNNTINKQYEAAEAIAEDAKLRAQKIAESAVVEVYDEYAVSNSPTEVPIEGWSSDTPEYNEGTFVWHRMVTTYGNASVTQSQPALLTGNPGSDGEDATVLRIDSSRGTVFKNDSISTVLTVAIYKGSKRITNMTDLQSEFGDGAYLQWYWQNVNDESFGVISSSDSMISNDGFSLTISPDQVDTKVTFMCELII